MWNRLGIVAGQTPVPDKDVDFLPALKALHDAGYHVLLFDVRGHGESERGKGPHTYGPVEARDFVAAVAHLRSRPDVDSDRIGAIGTSAGGNIVLYPSTERYSGTSTSRSAPATSSRSSTSTSGD